MKYLIELKNDLIHHFDDLTPDKVELAIINGEIPKSSHTIQYIARFLLKDCRINNPFDVLGFIRKWFEKKGKDIPDLSFDSDVIDLESFDLQIDISLFDKLSMDDNGSTKVCPMPVWSDALGTFINGAIVNA